MTYAMNHSDFGFKGIDGSNSYVWGDIRSFAHTGSGTATPEPATLAILALGGGAILLRRVRKRNPSVSYLF